MSSGDGHDKGDSPWKQKNDSNIVPLKVPRKKTSPAPPENEEDSQPIFNMPSYTKYMLLTLVTIHIIMMALLDKEQAHWIFIHLGFIPGRFTGNALFEPLALLTPFTHMLLHGSGLHIAMNTVMLLAFGSGIERWVGGPKMIALFLACGLFGVATHFALNYDSYQPVIGASGGLSGLFAVALVMLNRQNSNMSGKYGVWPFVFLWIGISVLFGFMGSPDGGQIAWAAHVGGFLGGFVMIKLMRL